MSLESSSQIRLVNELCFLRERLARLEASIHSGGEEKPAAGKEVNYSNLVEQIPAIFYTGAIDDCITTLFVSPQVKNILGYSQDQYTSDPDIWRKKLHPEDRERVLAHAARCIQKMEPFSAEYRMLRSDGSVAWFRDEALIVQDDSGKPLYMQGVMIDITERKRVEDQLRESEDRYRTIFRHSPLGVMYFDSSGTILDCNDKLLDSLGLARETVIGSNVAVLLGIGDLIHGILTSLSGEAGYHELDLPAVPGNGPQFLRCYFSGIKSQSGDLKGCLCIVEDVRARLEAEAAIRQSEARYRAIVEAQTELVSRFLADGTLTFVNEAYCRYFGESRSQLIGNRFWHHVPTEEGRQALKRHIASLSMQNPVATIEHEVVTSGGEIRWQQWTDLAIFDDEGNIVDIQAVGRDITERKEAELALQVANQQLQDIIEFLPDATFVIDKEKRVIAWNRAIEEMTGVKKESILGKGNYAHAVPFYGEARPILIDLVVDNASSYEEECDFIERRGNIICGEVFVPKAYGGKGAYLWGTASQLFDTDGRMIGAIQTIRDITERKQAQDAIQKSEKQLRFLSSRLLNAHEEERKRIARELHDSIGQSLAAVKFFVENTLKSAQTEEANHIVESLQALVPMIQNTMQEARRIYTGLRPSILDDLGIVATIGWFCREFKKAYPAVYVDCKIDVDERDVPEELKIVIFRVIQEAMNNVAKHSGAEFVEISLSNKEGILRLHIEDTGTGFDPDAAMSRQPQDRGLGLTGMKERTELSGGVFTITSAMHEGTSICASWPCDP
ncbi:MAG: PAS domain S-box protein [Deltaproteobacteria bacterium]|nr:PAS domain S-box protein [Deltaproteobacteria bacterium]